MRIIPWLVLGLSPLAGGGIAAQDHDLGKLNFPISCSPPAQAEFNHAVALLHHMTYPRAQDAFRRTATLDPQCAMAYWGIAMTRFQPLWPTRPGPAERRRGWEDVERARNLRPATERERLFVAAAAAFFQQPDSADYWPRIRRWEAAMQRVFTAYPQDPEAAAFYALAHLALPAAGPDSARAHGAHAADLLLAIYRQNPDHPGAMHYLVHANDVPGREHDSLAIVGKYENAAPRNPHALHMPTHIYVRLGDWDGTIRGNRAAAAAALDYPAGDQGQFVWDEFPHAIEYLVYAYLQQGADDSAAAALRRLERTARLEPSFKTAFHLSSTRARYALERQAWSEARALVPRDPAFLAWERFTWPEAVTWFARGLGAAHLGAPEEARTAVARLDSLEAAAARAGEDLFVRNIRILGLELRAWLAQVELDRVTSVTLMREAVELEKATPKHAVTPAPTLPAFELLGDLLLEQKRPAEALAAYRHSLELYPRRFRSLLGAGQAADAAGDSVLAARYYRELLEMADGTTRASEIEDIRSRIAPR